MADGAGTEDTAALKRDGLVALNKGEHRKAEQFLARAIAADPKDAAALQLMGVVKRLQGQLAEAEDFYRRSIARDPAQPQVHHNLGNLLAALHKPDDAIAAQREAIHLKPNFAEAHLGLALSLSVTGDHVAAEKACRIALRYQPNYLLAKQTLAAELNALGRAREAEQVLRQLLQLGIPDPTTRAANEHNLGVALKLQGRWEEALPLFDLARARAPGLPAVDVNQGETLQHLGRYSEAIVFYGRALSADPDNMNVLGSTALAMAQANDFAGAREFGRRALARGERDGVALAALALADISDDQFAQAEEKLAIALDRHEDDPRVTTALGIAADALDRRQRAAAAFKVYAGANALRRAGAAAAFENARAIREVRRFADYFERAERWAPSPPSAPGPTAGHVFLLGFMRSGTTLLATILSSNPNVLAIDEREYLTEPARAFLLDKAGLDRLAHLDEQAAAQWRNAYWRAVRAAGLRAEGKVFVDKMPFNSLRLPLIARLFPDAKVIFAIRDPRDVVLSCFRRRFDITGYSFEYLDLVDCARFYSSVMTLAERYREKLPLTVLDHRYEDLIGDFDASTKAVCGFTGIAWAESMRDFGAAAETMNRRSVSAPQVRRSLYDAAGQWRHYREELAPALPILAPWVARFGYPAD